MKPILILLLGAGAIWAIKSRYDGSKADGRIMPQNQRGIAQFIPRPTPQQPHQLYSGMLNPPGASRPSGYIPGFGPYVDSIDPNSLYWNQV
jgi:hypothetical protein